MRDSSVIPRMPPRPIKDEPMNKCIAADICNCHKDSNGTLQCPEHSNAKPMSLRERDWLEFSERVSKHLREYTVPQYGDKGSDEITGYSIQTCVDNVARYAKRYGTQSREGQQELDFMKMAHYAQCAWEKYLNEDKTETKTYRHAISYNIEEGKELEKLGYVFEGMSFDHNGTQISIWKKEG